MQEVYNYDRNKLDEMAQTASEIKELKEKLESDKQELDEAQTPVSYTHLDVYKRQVSAKVQEKVKSAIETMTGLSVTEVNIKVASVNVEN